MVEDHPSLDRLIEVARAAKPPELSYPDADARIDRAIARARSQRRVRRKAGVAAAVLALAAGVTAVALEPGAELPSVAIRPDGVAIRPDGEASGHQSRSTEAGRVRTVEAEPPVDPPERLDSLPSLVHSPKSAQRAARAAGSTNAGALSSEPLLERARAAIRGQRADEALDLAVRSIEGGLPAGAWRMVQGDALRALNRHAEAADAYAKAAARLPDRRAVQAAYLEAQLGLLHLRDPGRCLTALDRGHVDAPGSALAERGLALRVRALLLLGKIDEARSAARRYVKRFPDASLADWMRAMAVQEPGRAQNSSPTTP